MKYGRIEDGEVVEIKDNIPNDSTHSNIQGDMTLANSLGWYEVVEEKPTLKEYESISEVTFSLDEDTNTINAEYTISSLSLSDYKTRRISELKQYTTNIINSEYPEYKQRSAALGLYSAEEITIIKDFIAGKITDCDTYEALINSKTTLLQVSNVTWDD